MIRSKHRALLMERGLMVSLDIGRISSLCAGREFGSLISHWKCIEVFKNFPFKIFIPLQKHWLLKWCCYLKLVLVLQSWDGVLNYFRWGNFVSLYDTWLHQIFICPMLCMENYHVYPNTILENEELQKILSKSEGKLKTGLKDLLSWVGCQCFCANMVQGECGQRNVWFLHLHNVVWQVARRCWSGNAFAYETICQAMKENGTLRVTLPHKVVDENILEQAVKH